MNTKTKNTMKERLPGHVHGSRLAVALVFDDRQLGNCPIEEQSTKYLYSPVVFGQPKLLVKG
jgi:hypothetical protein